MKIRSGAFSKMATRYKSAKEMELMAIYRLEFYRKKKNWKFCQDVCNKKADAEAESVPKPEPEASDSPTLIRKVLNETYVIDHEQDAEGGSELNRAFLETEPDKLPLTTLPESETDKSYPDCCDILPQEQNVQELDVCSEPDRAWPDWDPDYVQMLPALADYIWQNVPPPQQINTFQQVAEHQDFYTNLDYRASFDGWQCGDLWAQNVEEAVFPEGDVCDGQWYPDVILKEAAATANTEDMGSASLESFMLGAAAAPHSTEIDLRASPNESGCSLSSQQLAMAVAHHAHAIKRLLNEARAREQLALRSQSLEHFWDVPNRDPGPFTPPPPLKREETFIKDPFLAGSFKNSSDLPSSTRGRLRSRPGVIGIRMGRPYRL